jgi:hypothetical protein
MFINSPPLGYCTFTITELAGRIRRAALISGPLAYFRSRMLLFLWRLFSLISDVRHYRIILADYLDISSFARYYAYLFSIEPPSSPRFRFGLIISLRLYWHSNLLKKQESNCFLDLFILAEVDISCISRHDWKSLQHWHAYFTPLWLRAHHTIIDSI